MRLIDADALLGTLGVTEGCNNCQYSVGKHCFRVGYSTITCKAIADAPTVLPQMEWIPVSERLPEVGVNVLVCDIDNDIYLTHMSPYKSFYDEFYDYLKNVVAWMPLPKPYEENKE